LGSQDIQERAKDYALRAIRLVQFLNIKKDSVCWEIGKQYLRAATSIGANLAEAQAGESRADFIHKCAIAQKEARESLYWLELLLRSEVVPEKKLSAIMTETNEITAILTQIIVNTKKRSFDQREK